MANFTLDQTGQEIQDILDTVGNNQATQGQVLTADGNGGASWQTPSGGSWYLHFISFTNGYTLVLYTKSNTSFITSTLGKYLSDIGVSLAKKMPISATGGNWDSTTLYFSNGIYPGSLNRIYRQYTMVSISINNGQIDMTGSASDTELFVASDTVTEL